MCGIAGIIGSDDRTIIERMTRRMAHRGPDDAGVQIFANAGGLGPVSLGHRRLSVIDLSTAGHQPMSLPDGSLWLTYNGEIYNFADVRSQLEAKGRQFRSRTDSEVILHAFAEWGPDCVQRFVGMFAFGMLDIASGELWLVRDRLGVKPLYYFQTERTFAFASEIKALLDVPGAPREMDLESLDLFLTLGYVPGPRSMFRGIAKLPPGNIMRVGTDGCDTRRYWSLPDMDPNGESFDDNRARLEVLLDQAVSDRLVSDVPLGCFLSGGLDSSVVTAIMSRHLPTGSAPKTFCVGYATGDPRHDERANAAATARLLQTEHHDTVCTSEMAIENAPRLIWHVDEPVAEALLAPFSELCRLAREHVTVVLSGEGADEFLYGYRYYGLEHLRHRFSTLPRSVRILGRRGLAGTGSSGQLVRALAYCLQDSPLEGLLSWSTLCSQSMRSELYGDAVGNEFRNGKSAELVHEALGPPAGRGVDVAPGMDSRYRMVDYILSKNDKLSMAFGLEIRSPFLDHRIVEFLARVPAKHKLSGFEGKRLLRHVAARILPREVAERRKKPFAAPVADWLAPMCAKYLASSTLASDGVLRADALLELQSERNGNSAGQDRLWAVLVAEIWYRLFIRQERDLIDAATTSAGLG